MKTFFNIKLNFNFSKFYEYDVSAQDELGSLQDGLNYVPNDRLTHSRFRV